MKIEACSCKRSTGTKLFKTKERRFPGSEFLALLCLADTGGTVNSPAV